jgi:SagB-type dehydrogenase family enzyme
MASIDSSEPVQHVIAYHERTKHHLHRYARGPGYLDWETQPDPFRRYLRAVRVPLDHIVPGDLPLYDDILLEEDRIAPAPLDRRSVSQLFYDSLALSAWKQAGAARWALRVNPSSGNLHPTEGYLLCGGIAELSPGPILAHYAPKEHALEIRASIPTTLWKSLFPGLSHNCLLVGLSSIVWREAWKYGERAYRYCHHDVGHAVAAVSIAAAGLGWKASLLENIGTEDLRVLLGLSQSQGPEAEHPDCLIVVGPHIDCDLQHLFDRKQLPHFKALDLQGIPNTLSPAHRSWGIIEEVAKWTEKSATRNIYDNGLPAFLPDTTPHANIGLRRILHQRRSALAMDAHTQITRETFHTMLYRTLPSSACPPFNILPWPPQIHLAIFVHRVQDLLAGLYFLVRNLEQLSTLQSAMSADFAWAQAAHTPRDLFLFRLAEGDTRALSSAISCHQEIASDGCFSLGMIARFEPMLRDHGAWFYPRLFWECGMIGQVLYLEAEACGIKATGMGCYFDDAMHEMLGLQDLRYQSLYHFTAGGALIDPRLQSLPAYKLPNNG